MNTCNIIIYKDAFGNVKANVLFENENIWLTQKGMSELFDIDVSGIARHIKNIFNEEELTENSVITKFATSKKSTIYHLIR